MADETVSATFPEEGDGKNKKKRVFEEAIELLKPFGGYEIISTTVDETENLDPKNKALKEIFTKEDENKQRRQELKNRLKSWVDLLSSEEKLENIIAKAEGSESKASEYLNKNLKIAVGKTRKLEENYRTLALFYRNAGGANPIKNVSILNAPLDSLKNLDNPLFINKVNDEFKHKYDRLDLMNNYSLLVIPGFLGSKMVVDKWSRIAHDYKIMLITDFRNLDSPDNVISLFESGKFTGADAFRANAIMACNWLIGRKKWSNMGEEEDLYISPAAGLAGKIYSNNIAQVSAGTRYGVISDVEGTRFDIYANTIADMESMGLVPMVFEYGQVQAMSPKTLFSGASIGLQTYSVVRTFDWLTKTLMDYLHRQTFTNISTGMLMGIREEIARFYFKCKSEDNIFEKYKDLKVFKDPRQPDRVLVVVNINPFFPAREFAIKLEGKDGEKLSAELEDAA